MKEIIKGRCDTCGVELGSEKNIQQHLLGKKHILKSSKKINQQPNANISDWNMSKFSLFPIRNTILDKSIMTDMLSEDLQLIFFNEYCTHFDICSPEWGVIFEKFSKRHPQQLRVKELFETIEVYKVITRSLIDLYKTGKIDTVYDFACGHGLLGILLAYRFNKLNVVCVDYKKRMAFDNFVALVQEDGIKLPNESQVLENLSFLEGDFKHVSLSLKSYVICIHGCNEATSLAIEKARDSSAYWAMMPCCVRQNIYMERKLSIADDDLRHAINIGYISGKYNAQKINSIDRRITNRNIILLSQ